MAGYCALNIVYNTAGLYVAKHGSAALNVLTYALLLPLTTLLFSVRPLLGPCTCVYMWGDQMHLYTHIHAFLAQGPTRSRCGQAR